MKNRYLFRKRISKRKFSDLLRVFALNITADRAAELVGVTHKTTAAVFRLLRLHMADLARTRCPFHGVIEADESYFGPARVRGGAGV
jgi:transposase-like protein